MSVDSRSGLPVVELGGAAAVSSAFVFWRKNWDWSGLSTQVKVIGPFDYAITGRNQGLDFDLAGHVARPTDRQLVWTLDFDARSATPEAIGGGIAFKFDLPGFASRLGEPELLPGNRGWRWGRANGSRLEMRFEPPLATVYFERGQKSEVRALFYKGEVPQGRLHHTATLTLSDDMTIGPNVAERFGLDDPTKWPTSILNWPIAPWTISPVDLSFLNDPEKPAGRHGFLRAAKDALVFEDGTPARFWGTNLTASALFRTDRDNVRRQARRLSQLGFNLVRFTHHDSAWVSPNIFGDAKTTDTRTLQESMLDRLDWWIKCLSDEGIYVWLDLHVERNFKPNDGIDDFDEIAKGKPAAEIKGFNYVNASIQEAMRRFNEAYVTHHNPFTGRRYKDDPAIIAMLLTNENDATHHFGNRLLPDKKVPRHNALYMAQAASFAATHGLPKDKVWHSWLHGPSKLLLNELEHRFNDEMIRPLRALGVKAPIATTSSFGGNGLSSLPALTAGDVIAVHSYGRVNDLEKNPIHAPNLMHWMAAAQIVDRPLSVPEWNVEPFPVPDRHAIPLYIAGAASLQGWDAMMQYAYSQAPLANAGGPSNWHAFNDPALLATLPAAALLYRRQDVREADTTYVFAPTREQLFYQRISPGESVALRTAAEKGRLMIAMPQTAELPWLTPSRTPPGAIVITDPDRALIDRDADEAVSDTGQLRRNWAEGVSTIDTPRSQAAMGWIGGRRIALADVEIEVSTRNATVAVQSLTDTPIAASRALM
ncbi:MAG: cellulase family glycosylhydrolase, partial [Blastochloris sp.]|nr:cellulase family glycosylhydrolase [Blastochloris sp.]